MSAGIQNHEEAVMGAVTHFAEKPGCKAGKAEKIAHKMKFRPGNDPAQPHKRKSKKRTARKRA
jgi:hypothetical protein